LELDAQAFLEFGPARLRVESEEPNKSAVRPAQTLGAFDGRGFAGAVRADEAEDLALRDLK